MVFRSDIDPDNSKLKEYFTWRATAVLDHQKVSLINKIANEIVMKGRFISCCSFSSPPQKTEDGKMVIPKGTQIIWFTVVSGKGERFLPVFTDKAEMEKWKPDTDLEKHVMILTFDDFIPVLKSSPALHGVVINPVSDNFPLPRRLIADWMKKKIGLVQAVMAKKAEEAKKKEAD